MRRGWLVFLVLLLPFGAMADGGIIPSTAFPASTSIPDQRALLCWSNGIERLAIDTTFIGQGTNFAWVVPLPNKPAIEQATSGLFPTLEYIFRPLVVDMVFPLYSILLFSVGVGYLLLRVRKDTVLQGSDILVSVLAALVLLQLSACVAVALAFFLPYAVWRVRTGREKPWAILLVIFLVFLMSGLLLPALGTAGTTASAANVSVLSHEKVGAYDTTTLAANDARSLLDWLKENKYAAPPGTENAISNYIKRGWVFVATKLNRVSSQKGVASPPPLCFTFRTEKAVYPMQLTGIGSTNLNVELFVFGPSRAEANYFHEDRCAAPDFAASPNWIRDTGTLRIAHPLLQNWVAGSQAATKLSASLSQEQMKQDVDVQWVSFANYRKTFYSNQGAAILGWNWGSGIFTACLLVGTAVTAIKRDWQPYLKPLTAVVALLGFFVALGFFFAVPKTEVRLVRLPYLRSQIDLRGLGTRYSQAVTNGSPIPEAKLIVSAATNENLLLGGQIHEEDSPGNYLFRESTNCTQFFWFDRDGGEHGL